MINLPIPTTDVATHAILDKRMYASILRWQRFSRFITHPFMSRSENQVFFDFDEWDLDPDARYMVVSNHQSQYDAFILLSSFSPAVFSRLKPFRAMTANRFLMRGPIKHAALHMGCFPAKPHATLPSGIECAAELLELGHTIYICPEGKITKQGEQAARPGVAILAKLPNVHIIPARIQWHRRGKFFPSFQLAFGKPFIGAKMTAQEILAVCYALPLN